MRTAPILKWLRALFLACIAGGLVGGAGPSCAVPDPEYCASSDQCVRFDSDNQPMQLICNTDRHVCMEGQCFDSADCKDFTAPRCDRTTRTCTACRVGDASDLSCTHFLDRKMCVADKSGTATLC